MYVLRCLYACFLWALADFLHSESVSDLHIVNLLLEYWNKRLKKCAKALVIGRFLYGVAFYNTQRLALQPPHSTRSSSVVTLARPSTGSTLKITDRSFRYASPRLWSQLPDSFRQPRPHLSPPNSSLFLIMSAYQFQNHHSPSITPALFHSRLKTFFP